MIMTDHSDSAKYELMVYLVERGVKDIGALVAIKPDEAAEKFKGASPQVLEALTKYVKAAKKRITAKGYFFPGIGPHEHTTKLATAIGLRKYLTAKGKTLAGLGLTTSTRKRRPGINTAEDALTFLEGIKK
jgi:hypothetical protein